MTDKVYTHFSDEYQLEIIKKLNYWGFRAGGYSLL
jgi:hypothetical protein